MKSLKLKHLHLKIFVALICTATVLAAVSFVLKVSIIISLVPKIANADNPFFWSQFAVYNGGIRVIVQSRQIMESAGSRSIFNSYSRNERSFRFQYIKIESGSYPTYRGSPEYGFHKEFFGLLLTAGTTFRTYSSNTSSTSGFQIVLPIFAMYVFGLPSSAYFLFWRRRVAHGRFDVIYNQKRL